MSGKAWTVLDKVTIAYRGETYEIGRGRDYFGIWTVAGSRSQPLEWWPETQEGWSAAWTRFAVLEAPDGITSVGRTATRPGERTDAAWAPAGAAGRGGAIAAALLLGVGVALGIAGLFPDYLGGTSLASAPDNLFAHVVYLAAWTASGVLIALGGARVRVGALLAVGLSIVTFGLFLADAGTPIAGGAHLAGAGLVLSLVGWLVCAAGSTLAFLIRPARNAGPVPTAAGPVPNRRPGPNRRPVPATARSLLAIRPGRAGACLPWAGRAARRWARPCCWSWPDSARPLPLFPPGTTSRCGPRPGRRRPSPPATRSPTRDR